MTDPTTTLRATIPDEAAGRRFDQVLAELFPDYSRSRLSVWIKSGAARLDGATVAPRQLVDAGQAVEVEVHLKREVGAEAEAIALDIVHQDDDVIVVNKPAGLIVHPGAGNPAGTLQNALLHHDPGLASIPRAGLVHRLDKDTSGLLVVARTLRAHTALVEQLSERTMHRQYEAIVYGAMVAGGKVDQPIGRHAGDRLRQAVREDGREAVTHYRVRERFRALTLIECRLETGRTHQIRVHMAHVRHPIVGDATYGNLRLPKGATPELIEALRGFRRQALHAERLSFAHPADGREIVVEAPRPADMERLVAVLRDDAKTG
ncbi:MAG TPA: 23S rRNA pseudouridine(1911/1915/1917) synthase RluD [Dokdonella sp.]|uniref:23S rRNA pseudouridine(1911/1915/1917) synthase RluD n=1 Tax=Dokdonella sp. TaxID=2291710 RepID=UPI0025B80FC4|nr:23S rRNA pseudouridine(1911/1915/1917) synthase RluD [Dokdonella sp.]MBX3692122.1 23S rRNA pseudouridine(1911/1915/1917) synthase RluD [Dokdonella sp.]MCW5569273.1 23S rRNA pseudouridine(1911/1915/1917) synthase RluD [Dokdonella sp.]HNR92213.1 23S rRNA pseudouridine(1911/1915/1917) synthase RluD [Dokdonella sp.]